MMKTTFKLQLALTLILFIGISLRSHGFQKESIIKEVTVYLDGAEITRTSDVTVKPGKSEITFNKLSPYILESSIQVSGLKNTSILSINYGINYLSKQKQNDSIEVLLAKTKKLKSKISLEYDLISGLNEELDLIKSNKRLGNETETVSLEKLKTFAVYFRKRITELKVEINKANATISDYESEIKSIKKQLLEFNVDEKVQTGEIKLKLHNDTAATLQLQITYNINNAGWFPIYDIKADKINSPINLEYKAHVFQNSGEDWDDVKLVLSTSDPNTNNEKPNVNPKYLNFVNRNYQSQRATRSYNYKYNPLVKTVSGVVTSASDGLPLPGVTVLEKGTVNGTSTDFDGNYSLKTNNGQSLVYSFVSMKTEELPIHSSVINVSMDDDTSALEEVVITGYTTSTRAKSSVSSVRVSSESIENRPNASFVQTLAGQVSGLTITNSSGQPGGNSLVQLRGVSSIRGNKEPLFIVDGIPVNENEFRTLREKDIVAIDVLKDAGATAIYGNRGSNGVIVIKTKRNKNESGVFVETGITNTRFEIDKSYSIPSDGDVTVIEIDKFIIPAEYNYFAAPLLNENVFLTAKIGNWEQYNLLPAEANVYFEGSYSGKTNINPSATTDSLTVSLGVDPNIVVKRTQLNNFKKNTFIGNSKVIYKGFEIEIKNNKTSNVFLTVIDRIPKSQNKDIKIDDIDYGTSNYDKEKGILKWVFNLNSGKTNKLNLSYSVKFPKYKKINL